MEHKSWCIIHHPAKLGRCDCKKESDSKSDLSDLLCKNKEVKLGYIITAEVDTTCEENGSGDPEKVKARTLSQRDGYITFDIKGTFGEQRELTKKLCDDMIEAGFVSFCIGHSY